MKKIIADSKIPFLKGVLEPYFEVDYIDADKIKRSDVVQCDALLVRTRTNCNKELLLGSRVKFIATATIGYDHIDMTYCRSNGIEVATSAGCNASAVVQYVFAAMGVLDVVPQNTTLGIIGCGNVGALLRDCAKSMGFKVLCNDPPKDIQDGVDLDYLLSNSDVVTIHVPYTKNGAYKTESLADGAFFDKIKQSAILINSSRGEVVDEDALLYAINKGIIGKLVVDVWRNEPTINSTLLEMATISTPHIAGYSRRGKERATEMVVQSVGRYFDVDQLKNWSINSQHPDKMELNWLGVSSQMPKYFDIISQSDSLKQHIAEFESMRSNYIFREEFF